MPPVRMLIGVHGVQEINAYTKLTAVGRIVRVNINSAGPQLLRNARRTLPTEECSPSGNDRSAERRPAHASVDVAGNGQYEVDTWGVHQDTCSVIRKWCLHITKVCCGS